MKSPDFRLPEKTRDVYLYMPMRMINIFPTVGVFGNLNLLTGKKERQITFFPSQISKQVGTTLMLSNGAQIDLAKGEVVLGQQHVRVHSFDVVSLNNNGQIVLDHQQASENGLDVVYLKSYNKLIVMDDQTYHSAYVQMFMLGKYDKNLFDLVVASPYTRIYKLKK
jgi:dolichyl-diphosphooligosaccharide--protein glycosyltransferase/undecaprenyl-diphosphooligosaccharide--protein glycosyltransferase